LAPAVRAIADVEAYGAILWRPVDLAQLVTRHRAGVAAHRMPIASLPSFLARSDDTRSRTIAVPGSLDRTHPFVSRFEDYGIDWLLVAPVPAGKGFFWAGLRGAEFTAAQVASFEALVVRASEAQGAQVEPPEPR